MTVDRANPLTTLGRAIRELCAERSMTLDDLAAAAGIGRERLDAIVAGRFNLPFDTILALADGLDIEPSTLMNRVESLRDATGIAFGRRLRELRTQHGVSQERLASLTGLHRATISLLERGERGPRLDTILRMAQAIGLPPEAFVTGLDMTAAKQSARLP